MEFSHELSVGNRAIDSEHKKLQDIINEIVRIIKAGEVAALSETYMLLAETFLLLEKGLYAYFTVEESIAEAFNLDFAQHRLAHQHLLKWLQRMRDVSMAEVGRWPKSEEKRFIGSLMACLTRHIEEDSKPLKALLNTQLYGFNPCHACSQQLLDKAVRISREATRFIEECNRYLQNSKRLSEACHYKLEEQMILEEESISNKCESHAIFKLENAFEPRLGIEVLEQIDEIRHASIPDEYSALHALRSKFLGLSFLPA